MADAVQYELQDTVACIGIDDGKANALSHEVIEALHASLDRAEKEAQAVLLVGRPGRFSAGFDLGTMRAGPEAVRGLVTAGAELLLRLYTYPRPVVAACTGHALAAGALVLLASDLRVGARGDTKIGLNEVAIGMGLPIFAVEFARDRLSKRHFQRATAQAELYAPDAAVDAGYLDQVVEPDTLVDTARAEAARLAQLSESAFTLTRDRARATSVGLIRGTLAEDMRRLTSPA